MTVYPTKSEFLRLSQRGNLVPVYADLMADFETPVSAYSKLKKSGPAFLLESVEGGANLNRYSFIGCTPRKIITVRREETQIVDRNGGAETIPTPADPLAVKSTARHGDLIQVSGQRTWHRVVMYHCLDLGT